jgi:hypothetical protein
VESILSKSPGLDDYSQALEVSRLGRDSNNFVHLVRLSAAAPAWGDDHGPAGLPGTSNLPSSVQRVVVRISNPDALLDNTSRVENEVAAVALMRDALSTFTTRIVPNVHAWNTAASGDGWIVQEYMPGSQLTDVFAELAPEKKRSVLYEIAQVFQLLQSYVPTDLTYGGVMFGEDGNVCSGALSIWGGGPFENYADMCTYILRMQIERSKSTTLIDGWRDSNLAQRLRKFDESGAFSRLVGSFPTGRPTLVHGDLGQSPLYPWAVR